MSKRTWGGRKQARLDFDAWTIPEPNTGCVLWLGHVTDRYGILKVGTHGVKAHRFSYERTNGPIPDRMCVLHRCDTPLCVNPAHLFLGTQHENVLDRERKGRGNIREALAHRWR